MLTQTPGFADPIHDAQQTFRALLDALARPGRSQTTATVTPPSGLEPAIAAAALTLLDLEAQVWLQPGLPEAVSAWLLFHTGCRFVAQPQMADFALIGDGATLPDLHDFAWGTPEYPEASTTLLVQCDSLASGPKVTLAGPGIRDRITVNLSLGPRFWRQWQDMTAQYPLGVDIWCFAGDRVLGLPRTARIQDE